MDLKDVFFKEGFIFDLKGNDKIEVFDEMIEVLYKNNRIRAKENFKYAILKREEEGPTGIGNGIAIPHGVSDSVNVPTIIYGYKESGLDYESLDDTDVSMVFMIAVPKGSNNEHLKILSQLARTLVHKEVVEGIRNAKSPEEILKVF